MNLNRILMILIAIMFIVIACLSVYYKFDACNVCKLEYNNEKLDGSQFISLYSSKCFKKEFNYPGFNSSNKINFTFLE